MEPLTAYFISVPLTYAFMLLFIRFVSPKRRVSVGDACVSLIFCWASVSMVILILIVWGIVTLNDNDFFERELF